MIGNEEQNQSVLDLSKAEFKNQVNLAKAELDKVYETSTPLLALGYNGVQTENSAFNL